MKRNVLHYLVDTGLVITLIISFTTAIIKFPGFLSKIGVNQGSFPMYIISVIHDWNGIVMGTLVMVHIVLHWKWIVAMTKKMVLKNKKVVIATPLVAVVVVSLVFLFTSPLELSDVTSLKPARKEVPFEPSESKIFGEVKDTDITRSGKITIEDVGEFEFNPAEVERVRKDIFKRGHFSVFAVLVHLDSQGLIDMEYHFDESADTHVIDAINGKFNWWYTAYYDGGWREINTFRMDHYPYKDKMYIKITRDNRQIAEKAYSMFKEEVERKKENNGKMVIPLVVIKGPTTNLRFENVEVAAHNLRSDTFQEGVITAIDVMLSLGDQELLSYDLQWYDSIGAAEIVRSYWVNRINEDESHGRCGFVYETGSFAFQGFRGNHIHIPADSRVITSPEYVEFFWICL